MILFNADLSQWRLYKEKQVRWKRFGNLANAVTVF